MSLVSKLALRLNHLPLWRVRTCVWGSRLRATSADRALYLWLHKLGLAGAADRRLFVAILKPGMTLVDVGANIGLYTLEFARLAGPSGRVYSFEPNPMLATQLRRNLKDNAAANVELSSVALGDAPGRTRLLIGTLNSGDSYVAEAAGGRGRERMAVDVEVDTLDARLADAPIDFIKIDVQGAEAAVLRGMQQTLARLPDVLLYLEVHGRSILASGMQPIDFLNAITRHGLILHREADGKWQPINDVQAFAADCLVRPDAYTNILCAREGHRALEALR